MEDSFAGFLAPFVVKQFGWDKVVATYVTSVYWACFGGGSLFAIFIAPLFVLSKLLCVYSFMVVSSFTCLLVTSLNGVDAGVWISACMNGFFMSVFFPLFYAWVEEDFLHVTAKVNALIMISASVGVIINPVIMGSLMQKAPIGFCYILLGESVLLLLVYIIGILLSNKTKHLRRFSKSNINITVSNITAGHISSDTQINKWSEITMF
jgi:fucose permease